MVDLTRTAQSIPLALMIAAVSSSSFASTITLPGSWTPSGYEGIAQQAGTLEGIYGINAVRIDTTTPCLTFFTSALSQNQKLVAKTTATFLTSNRLDFALNGNYFNSIQQGNNLTTVNGIAVSDGTIVNGTPATAQTFNITSGNVASISSYGSIGNIGSPASGSLYNAVSGFQVQLNGALDTSIFSASDPSVAARSAIGLSQNSQYVYFVTIDGSSGDAGGATYSDLANVLNLLGSYNALNLSGGNTSSLVKKSNNVAGYTVLNKPASGSLVLVGNSIGVDPPLDSSVPEPATYLGGLVALGFGFLLRNKIKN